MLQLMLLVQFEKIWPVSNNKGLAKATGRKTHFQSSFETKQHPNLCGISNSFGFERRRKKRKYWSFVSESLNFTKGAFLFPIPCKASFLAS